MPRLIEPPTPGTHREPAPHRRQITRRDCQCLVDNEALVGRYELIDGETNLKSGQKTPHAYVITRLTSWTVTTFGALFARIQMPIDVAEDENETNEPEPDTAVIRKSAEEYMSGNPPASDVLLAIEVADTSLRFDLITKAALYARARIPEYWVLDLNGRRIVAHRKPNAGRYTETLEFLPSETLAPLCRPDAEVVVSELLPPASS